MTENDGFEPEEGESQVFNVDTTPGQASKIRVHISENDEENPEDELAGEPSPVSPEGTDESRGPSADIKGNPPVVGE